MGTKMELPYEWTGEWWPGGGEARLANYRIEFANMFRWRPWCSEHGWLGNTVEGGFNNPVASADMAVAHLKQEHGIDWNTFDLPES